MKRFSRILGAQRATIDINNKLPSNATTSEAVTDDLGGHFEFRHNFWNYFVQYSKRSTIHGMSFLTEDRTIWEKIWWIFSILISLYFCIQLTISTYMKWQMSPVIVSFATRETPAWMVPFAAVTICPKSKVRPTIFNFSHYYNLKLENATLEPEIELKLGFLSYLCEDKLDMDQTQNKFINEQILDFYEEIQPKFYENARHCRYLNKSYNCSELFVPILSDEGICYVFNILDRTQLFTESVIHYKNYHMTPITLDWNLEDGYSKKADVHSYPRRTLFAGVPFALEIELITDEEDLDFACSSSVEGYEVQIIHPQRLPRVHEQHFILPLDRVSKAGIAPEMTTTSRAVQTYHPLKRNCIIPSEKSLEFFKVYSQNNCQIECGALYMFSKCGCVAFYMPRNKTMPICAGGSFTCAYEAIQEVLASAVERKIKFYNGQKIEANVYLDCDCPPICTSMYYHVEYSQTPWSFRKKREFALEFNNSKKHISKLQVFFKGNQFITLERNEMYGSTEFLANIGGIFGLFIGFSVIGFIEIIYYLTLRVICNMFLYGKQNWWGTK